MGNVRIMIEYFIYLHAAVPSVCDHNLMHDASHSHNYETLSTCTSLHLRDGMIFTYTVHSF